MNGTPIRTVQEQREISLKEIKQATDRLRDLVNRIERLSRDAAVIAAELGQAEDYISAGGVSWLEMSDAEIEKALCE